MPPVLNTEELRRRVAAALHAGKVISLLLDYDGTLSPIVSDPDTAFPDQGVIEALKGLETCPNVRVAVVSGRTAQVLKTFLGPLTRTTLIGDHGAVLGDASHLEKQACAYREALAWLPDAFPGAALEDKGVGVGVHFRNVMPDKAPELMASFFDWWLANGNLSAFQVATGKMVFEVRPRVKTNKGTAMLGLLEQWFGESWTLHTLPVCVGDDTTDEDAFIALDRAAGPNLAATILVAEKDRPSAAHFRVPQVNDIRILLQVIRKLCCASDSQSA